MIIVVKEEVVVVKPPTADQIWVVFWEIREVKANLRLGKRLGRSSIQIDEDLLQLQNLVRELSRSKEPDVLSTCRSRLATIKRRVNYTLV
jgi:hypothetical protein